MRVFVAGAGGAVGKRLVPMLVARGHQVTGTTSRAGGLVMEMGRMMSHGAVVAREYGIPAVVGVPGATERIATGATITVDGSAGVVSIDSE
jgi:phosphohistidine swiveling domain-containing protein